MPFIERLCGYCGASLRGRRRHARYCSAAHRARASEQRKDYAAAVAEAGAEAEAMQALSERQAFLNAVNADIDRRPIDPLAMDWSGFVDDSAR